MIYYMIRHIASGEFMPELRRNRGYTHWNPAKVNTTEHLKAKITGVPRLFPFRENAHRAIAQWNALPNATWSNSYNSYTGDSDEAVDVKPDGRKKEDLEIVEVIFYETGNVR